jgi:ABC-type branched-subunit amino acid transport system substrate-binding protein
MKLKPALIMIMMLLGAAVVGCESSEGPAERAGKQIDQAAEQAGDTINEAVDKAGEKIEETGDAIQEKAGD